jgi:hypothetical protein
MWLCADTHAYVDMDADTHANVDTYFNSGSGGNMRSCGPND